MVVLDENASLKAELPPLMEWVVSRLYARGVDKVPSPAVRRLLEVVSFLQEEVSLPPAVFTGEEQDILTLEWVCGNRHYSYEWEEEGEYIFISSPDPIASPQEVYSHEGAEGLPEALAHLRGALREAEGLADEVNPTWPLTYLSPEKKAALESAKHR